MSLIKGKNISGSGTTTGSRSTATKKRKRVSVEPENEVARTEPDPSQALDKGKGKADEVPTRIAISTECGDGNMARTLQLHKPVLEFREEDCLVLF